MICKAANWQEVDDDFTKLPTNILRVTAKEIGIDHEILNYFSKPMPKLFIVSRDEKEYLVNTEGYNYAKYIRRIK